MSQHNSNQGRNDATNGKGPADMQNAHWKAEQDYNAAFAAQKAKEEQKK